MTDPVLDCNDQALTGLFLHEMFRFQKFVRAQGQATDEHVIERIDAAYNRAREKFAERQQGDST